jgi:hypothetical protein
MDMGVSTPGLTEYHPSVRPMSNYLFIYIARKNLFATVVEIV